MPRRTVAFHTLGCKANQVDTAQMMALLAEQGFPVASEGDEPGILILNTCAVTEEAAQESRRRIRQLRHRYGGSLVVVMGCLGQVAPATLAGPEGAHLVLGTRERSRLPQLLEEALQGRGETLATLPYQGRVVFEEMPPPAPAHQTRAVVKVQEGCNNVCTYCIVPRTRGPSRSREVARVVAEVEGLLDQGYREVVLSGINLAAYGEDLPGSPSLLDLLDRLLLLGGSFRIRLSSLEPTAVTDALVERFAGGGPLVPHLHLPLQSGSDRILDRMRRRYSRQQFREAVERFLFRLPDGAVSADVVVGFPGETEEDLRDTEDLIRTTGLMRLHVFPFSSRPGTPAASFSPQVPRAVREERAKRMRTLEEGMAERYARRFVGRRLRVLSEHTARGGAGYSDQYLRVTWEDPTAVGRFLDIEGVGVRGGTLLGRVLRSSGEGGAPNGPEKGGSALRRTLGGAPGILDVGPFDSGSAGPSAL